MSNFIMPSSANLKAAQAVVLSRIRHRKGLSRDASKRSKRPLTLRDAEAQYHGSSRATIQRILKKLEAANTADLNDIVSKTIGRPRILTDEEEEAIVAFVMWMERSGLPACNLQRTGIYYNPICSFAVAGYMESVVRLVAAAPNLLIYIYIKLILLSPMYGILQTSPNLYSEERSTGK